MIKARKNPQKMIKDRMAILIYYIFPKTFTKITNS